MKVEPSWTFSLLCAFHVPCLPRRDTSVGHLHNDSLESYQAGRSPRQDDPPTSSGCMVKTCWWNWVAAGLCKSSAACVCICWLCWKNHLGTFQGWSMVSMLNHKIAQSAPLDVLRTCFSALAFLRSLAECRTWSTWSRIHCSHCKVSRSLTSKLGTPLAASGILCVYVTYGQVMFRTYHLWSNISG